MQWRKDYNLKISHEVCDIEFSFRSGKEITGKDAKFCFIWLVKAGRDNCLVPIFWMFFQALFFIIIESFLHQTMIIPYKYLTNDNFPGVVSKYWF